MLTFFEILTLLISSFFLISTLRKLKSGSIGVIYCIFWIICVLPLLLDHLIGVPKYNPNAYKLFVDACYDETTRILYCIYLIITQLIMMRYGRISRRKLYFDRMNADSHSNSTDNLLEKKSFQMILLCMALAVPILTILFRLPIIYLISLSWRYDGMDLSSVSGYGTLERLSYIGVVASTVLIFMKKKLFIKILMIFLLYMNVCIEGKRSAVFFALAALILCYLEFSSSKNKIFWVLLSGIVITIIVINLTFSVQNTFRGYTSFDDLYRMLRIDLFRDDTIKSAIYCILHPSEVQILNFPFQSVVMQIGFLFPLVFTGIPRVGYETYLTAALKYRSIDELTNGVRMTPSLYDCALANFGIVGFLIGGLIAIYFAKCMDRSAYYWRPIIACGFMLYSMYSFAYICWYFEFFFIIYWMQKHVLFTFGKKTVMRED